MQTITNEEYINEVEQQAAYLIHESREAVDDGEYEDVHDAIHDLVHHILDAHEWFVSNQYTAADHGAIIEFADAESADMHRYRDPETLTDSDDAPTIVKRLAYGMFEAHVIETARVRS